MFDDQRLVLEGLDEVISLMSDPRVSETEVTITLMAAIGAARRLRSHLGVEAPLELLDLLGEGEHVLIQGGQTAFLTAASALINEGTSYAPLSCVDELKAALTEAVLDEGESGISEIVDALYDLDQSLCACEVGGLSVEGYVDLARDIALVFAATGFRQLGRNFISRHGAVGGAAPVWAALASLPDEEEIKSDAKVPEWLGPLMTKYQDG